MCYLPPEDTSRRTDGSEFFENLLAQVYEYQNSGLVLIGGDFNARCGELSEYIEGVDSVADRDVIDLTENSYDELLNDFMVSANMCMLNGRLGVNNFTSVSKKERAVADYCITPYEQINMYKDFRVLTPSELIEHYKLAVPNRPPDHSVLLCSLNFSDWSEQPSVKTILQLGCMALLLDLMYGMF